MHVFFLVMVQVLYYSSSILAIQYDVKNLVPDTPGGARFDKEIGIPYTQAMMETVTNFIWNTFQEYSESDRVEGVQTVTLNIISGSDVKWAGRAMGDVVNISSIYIEQYELNDLKRDYTSLLFHEMTHVFQWYGGVHRTPQPLIEGIAEYMVLVSDYPRPVNTKPGEGERWDEGYGPTARFLEYCEGLKSGFVPQLNKMMKTDYSEDLFLTLLGKSVGQLWKEYKQNYGYNV